MDECFIIFVAFLLKLATFDEIKTILALQPFYFMREAAWTEFFRIGLFTGEWA